MDIETVDVEGVLTELCRQFGTDLPEGLTLGRTALRNALSRCLHCSPRQAEDLVDLLILRSSVKLIYVSDGTPFWRIADRYCPAC
jgi:hypothetical protein